MKNIILKILVIFLKILYLPMKHLKTKNKITYMSREANKETLDFKCIRQEMEEKGPTLSIGKKSSRQAAFANKSILIYIIMMVAFIGVFIGAMIFSMTN